MSRIDVALQLERRRKDDRFQLQAEFSSDAGVTVVYGASGAGKSTLLLAMLGALRPTEGVVRIGEATLFDSRRRIDLPLRKRRIGFVFQDAALFPHWNALQNVAFAVRGADAQHEARRWLSRVGAERLAHRRPHDLSGGETQRIALARSLACRPRALLLDEPFSQLDRGAREQLGRLLVELQNESGVPFVLVTHDLADALRLGDQMLFLDRGRLLQQGTPLELVTRPGSVAVAQAVGTDNLFRGLLRATNREQGWSEVDLGGTVVRTAWLPKAIGQSALLGLRAEEVLLSVGPTHGTSARNQLTGTICELRHAENTVELGIDTPVRIRARITPIALEELDLGIGKQVTLLIKATAFHLLGEQ